jgi:hypothetical protein
MMKKPIFFLLVGCLLLACAAAAQEPLRGPDGGTRTHVSGVVLLPVPGKPFYAKTSTDWTRTLEDGTTMTLHLDAILARDSQGRVYRENHTFVPVNSKKPSPLYEIHIYDPITHTQMRCEARAYRCYVTGYRPTNSFEATPEGPYNNGNSTLTREQLGSDAIEGIYVQGTRETWTVNAGVLGNERPLVSTREFWYSDELQTNLAVTRIDPREGKQVIRLSGISRAEPDPHLFDVPIGFTVRDLQASAGSGR